MKRIVASVGLVALGVSSVYAAYAPGLSAMDTSKAWSVSASLRGFYDDNYLYYPSGPNKRDTFGLEVSPSLRLNFPLDQTFVGLGYIYTMEWYEDRENNNIDQTHQIDFIFDHAFSERHILDLQDSFVITRDPQVLSTQGGGMPYWRRTDQDALRNQGRATFHAELTRLLGVVLGYNNTLYDYQNNGAEVAFNGFGFLEFTKGPSLSGLMDRIEHLALVNLRWQALRETTAVLGYNFGVVNYTSDEYVAILRSGLFQWPVQSDIRDAKSHYVYGGVDHTFLRSLTASIRGGAQFVDYYDDNANNDNVTPYADVSLSYGYAAGCQAQVGFTYSRNATDMIDPLGSKVTSDQQSAVVYTRINHRITPKLVGTVSGQYQDSTFHGGKWNNEADHFFLLSANLTYHISPHLSAEAGYSYDNLNSDVPNRDYSRNRVYLGVNASY